MKSLRRYRFSSNTVKKCLSDRFNSEVTSPNQQIIIFN